MLLDTLIFDPSPCGFPRPRLPLLPVGLDGISLNTPAPWAPAAHFRHFSRGRYALREAYRLAGIGPGSTLFAPAYHCRTMLDPALALGAGVALYPLRPDLSPDLAALDALVDAAPTPVKALLATHFFGIARDFAALADWCAGRNVTLIEDASHAFFTQQHRPPAIGGFGAFVVSSPYKFLPSPDGGLLYAKDARHLQGLNPAAAGWGDELRGIVGFWQKTRSRQRPDIATLDAELAALAAHPCRPAIDRRELAGTSADYSSARAGFSSLRFSRFLYRHPDVEFIIQKRRDNYQRWSMATMNLPYCRPLYPELPEGCIPYMFPLIIDQAETHFYWLKRLGVPIWRWDSMAAATCPTATRYRFHLLHLPCHQSLDESEMDWMISTLTKVGAGRTAPDATSPA
ncbi:MAG: DegT/DnrJ/EryC1/StrS family aminotransferase [Rhodocyclaceae bacterium]|nr:DegT/DnrJ/EryC1/StrS family aminotransferase [Rhodocyclaceae bacterium]